MFTITGISLCNIYALRPFSKSSFTTNVKKISRKLPTRFSACFAKGKKKVFRWNFPSGCPSGLNNFPAHVLFPSTQRPIHFSKTACNATCPWFSWHHFMSRAIIIYNNIIVPSLYLFTPGEDILPSFFDAGKICVNNHVYMYTPAKKMATARQIGDE